MNLLQMKYSAIGFAAPKRKIEFGQPIPTLPRQNASNPVLLM
jgi:hypothetical protein